MKQVQKIDSGILQFAPKGAFYEGASDQFKTIFDMWVNLFNYDRTLFCLISLLNGTGFSKGSIGHLLLSNPQLGKELIPKGLSVDYEAQVIKYNLWKEKTPRALKNLLMLAGKENTHSRLIDTAKYGRKRVNNSRTRKIILEYIFNRDHESLDNLAVNYKGKLKKLIRHALGNVDLHKILSGDTYLFDKWIGRYHSNAMPVLFYLFDRDLQKDVVYTHYKKIQQVRLLKKAAIEGDVKNFKKLMKGLPVLTVMGYRNLYKVPIEKEEVYTKSTMSSRQKLTSESAAKRAGADIKVNYKKQDIYDLWKVFFHKVNTQDEENLDKIFSALEFQDKKLDKIDMGETVIILDCSGSMQGSEERPLHPFLTAISIISVIENVKEVIPVGGKGISRKTSDGTQYLYPQGSTKLWKGLIKAVSSGVKNIVVISDGYENNLKGMFEHVYDALKKKGKEFDLIHINPVFSADAKMGTARKLTKDTEALPVTDYKFLETELLFNRMLENKDMVKKLLLNKYTKLIGG